MYDDGLNRENRSLSLVRSLRCFLNYENGLTADDRIYSHTENFLTFAISIYGCLIES